MVNKREDNGVTQHATAIVVALGAVLALWGVAIVIFPAGWSVPMRVATLFWLLLLVPIAYLWWLLASRPSGAYFALPNVKQVRDNGRLVVVSSQPWLGMRVQVSVYILDGDFERHVSSGYVVNIQTNNLVQISLTNLQEEVNPFDSIKPEKIIVKPGLYVEAS